MKKNFKINKNLNNFTNSMKIKFLVCFYNAFFEITSFGFAEFSCLYYIK